MATSKEYKEYIEDQLKGLDVSFKAMMGEYILYYKGVIVGGIYDDRLLVKETKTNESYNMEEQIPYPTAKPMYAVEDVDNIEQLKEIIIVTYEGVKK